VPGGHGEADRGHGEAQLREETSAPGIALGWAQVRVRFCAQTVMFKIALGSVADPDPRNKRVFGPPGSGSISLMYGSDPSVIKEK
jgi:hypothetical protein